MHDAGEVDVRACYTAISVSYPSLFLSTHAYTCTSSHPYMAQTTQILVTHKNATLKLRLLIYMA